MHSRALLLALITSVAAWDCSTPLTLNGVSFDLSKLGGTHEWQTEDSTPPTVTKTKYTLSLCSALPEPSSSAPEDDCPAGTRLCIKSFSSRSGLDDRLLSVVPIAGDIGAGAYAPQAYGVEGVKAEEGWTLELQGGTYNGHGQKARVEMRCDSKATETTPTVKEYDAKAGILDLKWVTSAACPSSSSGDDSSPPPSDPPPAKDEPAPVKSSGMGFFGWFFTLLFLGFAAYLALGIWNNYTQYGATGWDAVPHRDVWRDLPYVVADLFKGRGGSRNGYSALG
ncbi:hypothetical protein JCM8097_004745 [Rhodosporidiobolus ruineniae]